MYRSVSISYSSTYSSRWIESWAWLLIPLSLWLCVSVSIRYGSYGNSDLVLGPNSSKLYKASSIFVQQIQIQDDYKTGILVYGFSEKPELSLKTNDWNFSRYLLVEAYRRKVISFWLNKGSMVNMKWEANTNEFEDLMVFLYKGKYTFETMQPLSSHTDSSVLSNSTTGKNIGEAEYLISEDDDYFICILNMNPRNIKMSINVNVSSTMYDISNATTNCSTITGFCQFDLLFPKQHFIVLAAPNNGDLNGWSIELSFIARLVTYVALLGVIVLLLSLILKYIMLCERETLVEGVRVNEVAPLISPSMDKPISLTYGTNEEEDIESGLCNSSGDLYDGKICVICYDAERNSFFVPCGHSATCYQCAQRIMEGENKVCPICRRYIHKLRKLINS